MDNIKDNQGDVWEVFVQSKPGLPHKHAGSLHATDKEMALQNARDLYTRRNEGTCIWVVPLNAIVSSLPDDVGAFFDPANDKAYRHPTHYVMPEGAKHI
ncbi:MAG: 1,2-phenylacetyl-CoA epoxidase subunit B [Flavobacteriales bacterium CG18_big_fil_WC_8_21_14_2_50_32_9]|nr:1,2-phenylacetyl-CoA epoxidase subunit B [Flavobacteriales bacterium]PIQ16001.1 MAG: 1,2-phenylacetyl-CoA epoxidase subunit B [Flavobacteriales bacterium CG18_big_fil_WC_8_21_14_2_50_32_9]PIZ05366.1 MAG: 1,2-phenylacetyl-CoA epoxidase subunit B [Flavobacteriales bacterium CG_4_10_14_0_8_um_filter_32_5]PJC62703.1 MAG: 1,2-phenylacetyl-CoA epoxidase subunit B [Flavobacteriales bacterium CG_4_9_14_0_2_um_filter_32_27]